MSYEAAKTFDPHDPHGFHAGEHHGHVVVSPFVLINVLTALCIFTVLTVFFSRAEMWIGDTFNVLIPQWVNVVVALSIAVVKSTIVCMFFMQLKYDKPLNSLIFLFCLFAVALFLGFSMLDMGTQGLLYRYEQPQIMQGGTEHRIKSRESDLISREGVPITEWAKRQWKAEWAVEHGYVDAADDTLPTPTGLALAEDAWQEEFDHHHAGGHGAHQGAGSGPDKSRPRTGLTPGLYAEHAPSAGGADSHEADAGH